MTAPTSDASAESKFGSLDDLRPFLPHFIWTQAADGTIDYAGERWYEYTRLPRAIAVTPEGWARCIPPGEYPRVLALFEAAVRSGTPYETVHRLKPAGAGDDAYRWFVVRSEPVRDASGVIVRWLGSATDIHERTIAGTSFASEEFARRVLQSTEDCIKVLDLEGRLVSMSENGQRNLDIADVTPYLGTSWIEFWCGEHRAAAKAAVETARRGGTGNFQGYFPTMAGTPKWWDVVVTPMLGRDGVPHQLLASSRDITQLRSLTEALERSEHDHRALVNAIPTIAWSASGDGALDYVNSQWIEYTGMTYEQSLGFTWPVLIHPDDVEGTVAAWTRSVAERREHAHEYRLRRASDGEYRWHLTKARPIFDAGGALVKWFGTTTDVEERRRTADGLRFLALANETLNASLERSVTIRAIVEAPVPDFADGCAIYLVRNGEVLPEAFAHHDPEKAADIEEIHGRGPVHRESAIGTVARTGEPAFCAEVPDELRPLGARSCMIVPLAAGEPPAGVLVLVSSDPRRRFEERDFTVAKLFARAAAGALERAEAYERERHVATVLQAASLPAALPRGSDFHFDAFYSPGKREAQVGGDWYDAFALPDGRIGITIGDICGTGLHAAVAMGKLRQAMQAVAMIAPCPATMLEAANQTLRIHDRDGTATAVAAIFDPRTRQLEIASAGHPLPLLRSEDGSIATFGRPGIMLGVDYAATWRALPVDFGAGAGLAVFFTDGLVEATHDIASGDAILARALREVPVAARTAAHRIFDAVLPGGARDDVAVLTLTMQASPPVGA